jgi:hypothetical protein
LFSCTIIFSPKLSITNKTNITFLDFISFYFPC